MLWVWQSPKFLRSVKSSLEDKILQISNWKLTVYKKLNIAGKGYVFENIEAQWKMEKMLPFPMMLSVAFFNNVFFSVKDKVCHSTLNKQQVIDSLIYRISEVSKSLIKYKWNYRIENIVFRGENGLTFSPFSTMFSKSLFPKFRKPQIVL